MKYALLALIFLVAACDNKEAPEQAEAPPPAVIVQVVGLSDFTPNASFNGRVEAKDEVALIARVQGYIQKRHFNEGQTVKQGALLYSLEKAPFQALVAQREADVAKAKAEEANARVQSSRARELLKSDNIAKSEADRRESVHQAAIATTKLAQSALEASKIDLSYTSIKAPFTGRIGKSNFTDGALVGPSMGPLATLVAQDPIHVTWPVTQRDILEFRKSAAERGSEEVIVRLHLADGSLYKHPGKFDFLEVKADPGTDSVTVRAEFPNPDGVLVPGQFAAVTVETVGDVKVIAVPQGAIQMGQQGSTVLVLNAENIVEVRPIKLGQITGTSQVVTEGLKDGERVIVEGLQKVQPGKKATPQADAQQPQTPPNPQPDAQNAPQSTNQ